MRITGRASEARSQELPTRNSNPHGFSVNTQTRNWQGKKTSQAMVVWRLAHLRIRNHYTRQFCRQLNMENKIQKDHGQQVKIRAKQEHGRTQGCAQINRRRSQAQERLPSNQGLYRHVRPWTTGPKLPLLPGRTRSSSARAPTSTRIWRQTKTNHGATSDQQCMWMVQGLEGVFLLHSGLQELV